MILVMAVDDNVIGRNPCRMKGAGVEPTPERPVIGVKAVLALAGPVPERYRALILATFGSLRWGSWCPAQPVRGCAARKRAFGRRPGDRSACGRSQRPQAGLRLSLTVPDLSRVRTRSRSSTCTSGLVQNRQLKTAGRWRPSTREGCRARPSGSCRRRPATGCGSEWCHWSRARSG